MALFRFNNDSQMEFSPLNFFSFKSCGTQTSSFFVYPVLRKRSKMILWSMFSYVIAVWSFFSIFLKDFIDILHNGQNKVHLWRQNFHFKIRNQFATVCLKLKHLLLNTINFFFGLCSVFPFLKKVKYVENVFDFHSFSNLIECINIIQIYFKMF